MNFIDLILFIPIAWFAYKGFNRGLIIELATLLALLMGIYFAGKLANYTADLLRTQFDFHSEYMGIISFTLSFLVVVALVIIFGKSIEQIAKISLLGTANKMAGALFGILKAVFALSVFIFILGVFEMEHKIVSQKLQDESFLYSPIKKMAPYLFPIIKDSDIHLFDTLDAKWNDLKD